MERLIKIIIVLLFATVSATYGADVSLEDQSKKVAVATDEVPVSTPGGSGTSGMETLADIFSLIEITDLADITATALEINTPLDGATVTLVEFQQLQTIGATTISANQWAALGGIAETLGSSELDLLDGETDIASQGELDAVAGLVDTDDEIIAIINTSPGTQIGVPAGGVGVGTLNDGGLLVGAGTGAVEVLADGLTTQLLIGGGADTNPAWGTDIPTAVTIGAKYVYRADGTDVPDADVADDITITSISQVGGGTAGANAYDFGGATSLEVPNTAGDVAVDAAGEIAVDSTQRQLAYYDGTVEIAIPSIQIMQPTFDPGTWYDSDAEVWLMDLHSDRFPDGIVITKWYVDCNVADPDVEMDLDLKYADAVAGGAFPGGSQTLIDVMDTTTGNASEDTNTNMAGNGVVATGKTIYLSFGADPEGTCTQLHLRIHYYIPES